MKASELRIGNLYRKHNGQIETITSDVLQVLAKDICPVHLRPQPIPLTEEWLERIGFHHIKGSQVFTRHDWFCGVVFNDEYGYQVILKKDNWSMFFGEYVHQLQNLYFALTGEELTIK